MIVGLLSIALGVSTRTPMSLVRTNTYIASTTLLQLSSSYHGTQSAHNQPSQTLKFVLSGSAFDAQEAR
jgi:hypothetical protein